MEGADTNVAPVSIYSYSFSWSYQVYTSATIKVETVINFFDLLPN